MIVIPDHDGPLWALKQLIHAHLARRLIVAAFHIPLLGGTADAAKAIDRANDPAGVWLTQSGDARIKVHRCGAALCGRVVWLKEPTDKATGKPQLQDLGDLSYSAARGAQLAWVQALGVEVAAQGVRVNCLLPGATRSAMSQRTVVAFSLDSTCR